MTFSLLSRGWLHCCSRAAIPTPTRKDKKLPRRQLPPPQQVYVAPGKLDEYYAFLSGGQSGSVFVYGIPSCRFIKEIPIFEPRAGLGYANNPGSESYKRLAATGPDLGRHASSGVEPDRWPLRRTLALDQ